VEPEPTSGELIREVLVTGADESILFSPDVLRSQNGTLAYARTIDSVRRGFERYRFYPDTVEVSAALAFEADIMDTLWGTLTFNINNTIVSRPYVKASFGGNAKLLDNACFTCSNPWRIWKMRYRKADQPNGSGEPRITLMTVTNTAGGYPVVASPQVRINRDSVVTVKPIWVPHSACGDPARRYLLHHLPRGGVYQTKPMDHDLIDSLGTCHGGGVAPPLRCWRAGSATGAAGYSQSGRIVTDPTAIIAFANVIAARAFADQADQTSLLAHWTSVRLTNL
jgi:hypothetical protein